jgi:hypothetical protein
MSNSLVLAFLILLVSPLTQAQVSFYQTPSFACPAGTSFVAADFNADANLDIICSDGTVLLGNGDGTFRMGAPVSLPPGSSNLSTADFNGDGHPDLLVVNGFNLTVLLGNGDGTFKPSMNTYIGAAPAELAIGDLNGDGKSDLVALIANQEMVFLSKGDGTFSTGASYAVAAVQIMLGDFNGDHKLDLVVLNVPGQTWSLSVLLGNGDGTFQSPKTTLAPPGMTLGVAGDFNGDGKLDLVLEISSNGPRSNNPTSQISTLLGNGDGTFQTAVGLLDLGPNPLGGIVAADVDGDGKLDLVVADPIFFAEVLIGNGDGTFTIGSAYGLNLGGPGIVAGDFNNDGKTDVATSNSILLGNGDRTFQAQPATLVNLGHSTNVAAADFNGDGFEDLAYVTYASSPVVLIFLGDGTGAFRSAFTYTVPRSFALAVSDVNLDGKLDLVLTPPLSAGIIVLLGNGDGSFQSPISSTQCTVNLQSVPLAIGDFNGDHKPDIAMISGDSLTVCLGKGDGTFVQSQVYFAGTQTNALAIADFNNDGKPDIVVASSAGLALFLGNGDGTFQGASYITTSPTNDLETAELTSDGNADLITTGLVYRGNGNGTFQVLSQPQVSPGAVADINGDGKPDLVVGSNYYDALDVLLGNGDGTFGNGIQIESWAAGYSYGTWVAVADFNRDGQPDVLVAESAGPPEGAITSGAQMLLNTTKPNAGISIIPSSVNFGSVLVGQSSPAIVQVKNSGFGPLNVSSINLGGSNASEFSQTNDCSGPIAPGKACTINVTFSPTTAGSASASLSISDNAAGSPQAVALAGIGSTNDMGLGIPAGGSSSQTVAAGTTANYTLTIGGTGWTGTASLSCAGAPTGANCTFPGGANINVNGGTPSQFTVTVSTTSRTMGALIPSRSMPLSGLWAVAIMAVVILPVSVKRSRSAVLVVRTLPLLLLLAAGGCGGGSARGPQQNPNGTPAGTYNLTITATAGSLNQPVKLTLTVQ